MQMSHVLVTALLTTLQLHAVCGLHGGDMMLTREQQASLEARSNQNNPLSPQNAVVRNERNLWPNAVVPYIFDNSLGMLCFYRLIFSYTVTI